MSPVWVSLLFSIGSGTWLYTKFQRYSGNNTRQSVAGAAVATLVIFLIFFSILKLIL